MPETHPRRGSLQYWPRKRSRHSVARIRSWPSEQKAKPLGFIGYKVGMTHVMVTDNRPKSLTKNEQIFSPVTIIECPPLQVMGVSIYKRKGQGLIKSSSVLAPKLDKELSRKIELPKKAIKSLDEVKEFDEVKLLVHSQPKLTSIGNKKPKLLEIALGGKKEDKMAFAKNYLGKELKIKDVFEQGNQVDIHGITKGKGFQGTVKRYGVPIRQHKAEKTKRGIATLGPWHPNRVLFSVAQPGKMGYHQRTEYNKHIIKIGENGEDVTPASGLEHYGLLKNNYLLLRGSVMGPKKGAFVMVQSIKPNKKITKDAPEVNYINK